MTAKETTSVEAGAVSVPYGHVIGNEKWRGSQIAQGLQGKIKLILEDGLGFVDFHLSNRSCILYISESDLVAGNGFKRRLVRFRNASSLHGIVIVEKTQISDQYFPAVQKFIVLELGMTLLPVANQGEASQLIIQLVSSSVCASEQTSIKSENVLLFSCLSNLYSKLRVTRDPLLYFQLCFAD
ncbi:hypothetical protein KIL84_005402 [Mauremys mutica]|uniref:Fanconi anemia core complex-associated protein 24 pseudonuclease domain-containing protein n=1 Tax=Mauremys mutica TaxID=74926 RepID=A0A9D3XKV9_9SAUR|nr:hypothetical protein KIL84_005402 [Mauremys mutica]